MRCHWFMAGLIVTLLASPVRADWTYPPKENGVTTGVLTVVVAEEDASKPVRVDYLLTIDTNVEVSVKPPELVDAAGWKHDAPAPAELESNGRKQLKFKIHLEQIKAEVHPLPGITVRFRKDNKGPYEELEWTDILKESRELPSPPVGPGIPLQPSRTLWWVLGIGALVLGLLGVALWTLWGEKAPPPLTPTDRALRELDRIEGLGLAGPDETGWFPAEISSVIRGFLAERYGLPAQQQTTAEFLHTLRQTPELPADLHKPLQELLERCDLAKFAALRTPPDECRRIADLARTVVQQTITAPMAEVEPVR